MTLTDAERFVLRIMSLAPKERAAYARAQIGTDGSDFPDLDGVLPGLVDAGLVERKAGPPGEGDIVATGGDGDVVVCRLTVKGAAMAAMLSN